MAERALVEAAQARSEEATDKRYNATPENLEAATAAEQKADDELNVAVNLLKAKVAALRQNDPQLEEMQRRIAEADATLQRIRGSRTAKRQTVSTAFVARSAAMLSEPQNTLGEVKCGGEPTSDTP